MEDDVRSKDKKCLWECFTCQKCGRCCRQIGLLPWDGERLSDIANFLGMSEEIVVEKYYGRIIVKDGRKVIERYDQKRTTCPFLQQDNTCKIYPVRPLGCRLYPVETDIGRDGVDCPGLTI